MLLTALVNALWSSPLLAHVAGFIDSKTLCRKFCCADKRALFFEIPPHFFQGWGWYVGAEGITCGLEWTVPCESPSCVKEDMPFVLGFLETSDHALASERPFVLELDEPLPLPSRTSH